jgi:hypothetical protein
VPVISSVTVTQNTSGFSVQVVGFSTPREMVAAAFNFAARSGTLVRLKACLIGEVEVLFRYTLSGL